MKNAIFLYALPLAGLVVLNTLLGMYRLLPEASWSLAFLPTPELILVLLPVLIGVGVGRGSRRVFPFVGAVVGTVFSAYSLGEGAIQFLYSRAWEPLADYPLIRGAVLLISPGDGMIVDIIMAAVLVATALVLFMAFFGVLALVSSALSYERERKPTHARDGIAAATSTLVVAAIAGTIATSPAQALSVRLVGALQGDDFTIAATALDARQEPENTSERAEPQAEDTEPQRETEQAPDYGAPGFRDRDIYKFIVESYGITIFENEEIEEVVVPKIREMETRLNDAGYHSVSNFIRSPILGGQSWLAEATFLTGNEIDRQGRYEKLMEQGSRSIIKELEEKADYYSLAVKPGSINGHWESEAEALGFNEVMTAYDEDFGYEGPWFSFVPIPDQFAIWKTHQRLAELRDEDGAAVDRPLYLHYQLVSSHTPFNRIPEFFEDWSRLGDGSLYHSSDTEYFDNDYLSGEEYIAGYNAGVTYVLEVITDYLEHHIPEDDDSLFIIVGDHQPGPQVRGDSDNRAVPIHILSRDETLLEAWKQEYDYVGGMIPKQRESYASMADMFSKIMDISSRPPADKQAE
ncbi:MAG: hypothetical protein ACLFM0_05660 [Spirochaetales bacterium]